ncbi:LysR family transcriptional regulator [Paraburkholderia sp. BL27I4N3]|uniref:LysR family transcriptional regulator n=1 Tax=Paraburkholderia sp. BL27I4N3 TaxID=1938805 RepID=UPI000E25A105|nr:LysR family transcriptional regulator [Paraburkholderia sp. BL27I4N3]REE06548.1 LysR family transcriptional regulator [Paraburkholderia sp. BL27I4N3]
MDTLLNLRAFLAAARHGSFSEASRQMHVVPSVVAKRVTELERTTHSQLFMRSTRQLVLTDAGQKFLSSASALVAEFDAVMGSMKRQDGVLEGHIRVKMPTTLTVLYLANIVSAFQSENERITMEVVLVDRTINPIEEGYDVVVTGLPESYEGVTDIPLCPLKRIVCASPAYLRKQRMPEHPRDLADHDCLVFRPKGPSWQFESPAGPISVDVPQKLVTNDNYILFSSARAGNGVAVLPEYLVRDSLRDGSLQVVLSEFPLRATWLKALVPNRRERLPHIVAFTDWLRRHLANSPPWDAAPDNNPEATTPAGNAGD